MPFQRLFRLWKLYAYLDINMLLRDARTFFTWVISDTILTIASVTGTLLLATKFNGIGKWTLWQVVFMLGYAMIANNLVGTFMGYNVSYISRRIGRGQFDHTLVQPVPIWMSLLTEGFIPFSAGVTLLPGISLLWWATAKLGLPVSAEWLALLLLNIVASGVIILSYATLWGCMAFWSPRAAEEICSPIHAMMEQLRGYPLNSVGPVLAGGLLTVLPVGFIAWFPSRSLLGMESTLWGRMGTLAVALFFAICAAALFRRGLRHYYATGSQRYLSHGHRR